LRRRFPVSALTGLLIVVASMAFAGPAAANSERDAIDKLNSIRQANGLPALRPSESLHESADRYAQHMIDTDYFGHGSRIAVASRFGHAGETLALDSGLKVQPGLAIDQWMSSAPHRAVLLSRSFRWIGIGLARGRMGSKPVTVWVAHVGAR
jgi:uncharacterized protein YkwD